MWRLGPGFTSALSSLHKKSAPRGRVEPQISRPRLNIPFRSATFGTSLQSHDVLRLTINRCKSHLCVSFALLKRQTPQAETERRIDLNGAYNVPSHNQLVGKIIDYIAKDFTTER